MVNGSLKVAKKQMKATIWGINQNSGRVAQHYLELEGLMASLLKPG